MKEKNQNKLFYLILIVLLILIFSYRGLTQSRKMKDSIIKTQEQGLNFINFEKEKTKKEYETKKFITSDGMLSFRYSSQWSDLDEEYKEKLFSFLGHPAGNYEDLISKEELEELNKSGVEIDKVYKDYLNPNDGVSSEKLNEQDKNSEERFKDNNFLFTKMKTPFPSLSIGIISLQELTLEKEKTKKEILNLIKDELTNSSSLSEKKVEITTTEERKNFKIIETETLLSERPVFKAKNLIFIKNNGLYVLTLGTLYEEWDNFEDDFKKITASVIFNENQ